MPNFRYPNNCYRMLKGLDDIGRNTLASSVKHLLWPSSGLSPGKKPQSLCSL